MYHNRYNKKKLLQAILNPYHESGNQWDCICLDGLNCHKHMLNLYQPDILGGGFNENVKFFDKDIDLIADKHCTPDLYDFNDPEVRRIAVVDGKSKFKNLTHDQLYDFGQDVYKQSIQVSSTAMAFVYHHSVDQKPGTTSSSL